MIPKFVLKYNDGDYVATDVNSGGYPYPVKDIFQARIFNSPKQALEYIMNEKNISRIVYKVNLTVNPLTT